MLDAPQTSKPRRVTPKDLGIGVVYDRMHEAAIVMEATGSTIVLWNLAATEIFGYGREEAIGMDPIHLIGHEGQAAIRKTRHLGIIGPYLSKTDTGEICEIPALHKNGHPLRVEATFSTLDEVHIISIVRDVTRKKRTEALAIQLLQSIEGTCNIELPENRIPEAPEGLPNPHDPPIKPLTIRELQVLSHVIKGHTNAAIAAALFIEECSVKSYMTRIFAKLKVTNRAEAGVKAVKLGLLS